MPGAVKFIYGATTVYFSVDEVLDVPLRIEQGYQTHQRQDAPPALMYIGQPVESIRITFDLQSMETVAKLDAILAAGVELELYYAMQHDPTAHLHVVPLIDGIEEVDTYGMVEAVTKSITFVKTGL